MVNHYYNPIERYNSGYIIKFDNESYSWSSDQYDSNEYLLNSKYINSAIAIYVYEIDQTITVNQFRDYLKRLIVSIT